MLPDSPARSAVCMGAMRPDCAGAQAAGGGALRQVVSVTEAVKICLLKSDSMLAAFEGWERAGGEFQRRVNIRAVVRIGEGLVGCEKGVDAGIRRHDVET